MKRKTTSVLISVQYPTQNRPSMGISASPLALENNRARSQHLTYQQNFQ